MNERVRITRDGVLEIDLSGLWNPDAFETTRNFLTLFNFEWNEVRRGGRHRITAWLPVSAEKKREALKEISRLGQEIENEIAIAKTDDKR